MTPRVEGIRLRLQKYIDAERASDYSEKSLAELYDVAIELKKELSELPQSAKVPFALLNLLSNIDFGAIERKYRTWVLDDAERAISDLTD